MSLSGSCGSGQRYENSDTKTVNIPLFDCDGKAAILNTVTVSVGASTHENNWASHAGSSIYYSLVTDTGILIGNSVSKTYNLFDYDLGDSAYLILTIQGSVSGSCEGNKDAIAISSVSGSGEAKYIDLSGK